MRLAVHRRLGLVKAPWLQDLRPDGVTVRWETSALSVGSVRVGEAESADRAAGGGERCATLHEAVVSGLAPGTEHSYAVDWAACPGVADAARTPGRTWGSFRTAPEEGAPVAFVVYGDSRGNPAAHARVVAALLPAAREAGASFVVNTGDLTDRGDDYSDWQEQFFAPARPLLETLAFYPALGNHDHNHESWYDWFALPGNESWFSFRAGVAELFVLNAYGRLAGRSEQVEWLEEALAASVAPWRIVVVHQPTRSCMTGRDRRGAAASLREVLEPILVRGGVRLVFAGHDHLYGRSREIDGLTVVTTGGGGAPPYRAGEAEDHEACSSVRHFCLVEVGADEVRVRAIDDEGSTIDDFAIRRTAGDGGAAD
jgi:hypothetical protein